MEIMAVMNKVKENQGANYELHGSAENGYTIYTKGTVRQISRAVFAAY